MTEHATLAIVEEMTAEAEVLVQTGEIADLAETETTGAIEVTDQEVLERQELRSRKHNQKLDLVNLPRDGKSVARFFYISKSIKFFK